ncbi:hypothetical protein TRVA0_053S00562 [Trichomonascus vanleenenianus]|uniref:uncharacterized protein n=1 Tax=Trichomonascus vanleenenianus TaxID=2268995 RepID=UPI003ECA762D
MKETSWPAELIISCAFFSISLGLIDKVNLNLRILLLLTFARSIYNRLQPQFSTLAPEEKSEHEDHPEAKKLLENYNKKKGDSDERPLDWPSRYVWLLLLASLMAVLMSITCRYIYTHRSWELFSGIGSHESVATDMDVLVQSLVSSIAFVVGTLFFLSVFSLLGMSYATIAVVAAGAVGLTAVKFHSLP